MTAPDAGTSPAQSMSTTEPPDGGSFLLRARVLDAEDLRRAFTRIAHEIVERNHGAGDVLLIGLYTRGVPVAHRLADVIQRVEGVTVPVGALDVAFFRDDIGLRPVQPLGPTEVPVDVTGKVVILVDDVLFTGRTVRAALDALTELGRPRAVQLAVLVDRGHRELPIGADYVGKNLPTKWSEDVRVRLAEVDEEDGLEIWGPPPDETAAAAPGGKGPA
jgi:pyrimidine operon attenuation protein/uracil phosphoribosyltransferase